MMFKGRWLDVEDINLVLEEYIVHYSLCICTQFRQDECIKLQPLFCFFFLRKNVDEVIQQVVMRLFIKGEIMVMLEEIVEKELDGVYGFEKE